LSHDTNPTLLSIADEIAFLKEFFAIFYIIVPMEKDLWHSIEIQREYGLMGNDALILTLMRRFKIKYLATADADFKGIKEIHLVKGDWWK